MYTLSFCISYFDLLSCMKMKFLLFPGGMSAGTLFSSESCEGNKADAIICPFSPLDTQQGQWYLQVQQKGRNPGPASSDGRAAITCPLMGSLTWGKSLNAQVLHCYKMEMMVITAQSCFWSDTLFKTLSRMTGMSESTINVTKASAVSPVLCSGTLYLLS